MSGVYRTAQICKNGHVITSNTSYSVFYQISVLNVALKLFQLVCTVIVQSVGIMIFQV